MTSIDILGFCLSIVGIFGLAIYLRYLLPHRVVTAPHLSALLNKTQQLLDRAEALNAIPLESEYRTQFDLCEKPLRYIVAPYLIYRCSLANQLTRTGLESNHAWGTRRQLQLAVHYVLTCRLYGLYCRIETLRSRLEVRWSTP
jgi:hypothetical protein